MSALFSVDELFYHCCFLQDVFAARLGGFQKNIFEPNIIFSFPTPPSFSLLSLPGLLCSSRHFCFYFHSIYTCMLSCIHIKPERTLKHLSSQFCVIISHCTTLLWCRFCFTVESVPRCSYPAFSLLLPLGMDIKTGFICWLLWTAQQ